MSKPAVSVSTSRDIAAAYPLSPMQQGMLFHTIYSPTSGIYVEQQSWTLAGDVDVPALQSAWQQIVARHSVLRTSFVWEGLDQPLQVVEETINLNWEFHDWRDMPQAECGRSLQAFLQADRQQPFALDQAPLMKLKLIRLPENSSHLIWTYHHILLDGWSSALVLHEVFAMYQAITQNRPVNLGEAPPYRHYINWLTKQNLRTAEEYWRRTLHGITSASSIGIGKTATESHSATFSDEKQVHLSVEKTKRLEDWARREQLTLNTVVQGAWAILLGRYSGANDVAFGVTASGRPPELPGIEGMVGLFINTLPLRVQVREEEEVGNWLRRLQQQQAEQRQYEYSSLAEVQGWSEVGRGEALFESIVVFENYPVSSAIQQTHQTSSQTRQIRLFEQNHYPLILAARPGPELALGLMYERDRFEPDAIERLLDHLAQLLEGMTEAGKLREVPLLSRAEVEQQLSEWNDTRRAVSAETVVELFERQVSERGKATALRYGEEELSYEELNRRANRLGWQLRELGVGVEVRVGIALERGPEMVVGLLGVLKAGGAYVPLDAEYPSERLSYMMKKAGVALVLTEAKVAERLPACGVPVLKLEEMQAELARQSEANLEGEVRGENLAYIIYTSGSTGKPKGVMISHAALTNFLQAMRSELQPTNNDVLAAVTSLSFDIAGLEIFLPLVTGAGLAIVSRSEAASGETLLKVVKDTGATLMQATPTTWRLLVNANWKGNPSLKALCGGEALPPELAKNILEVNQTLWNLYGPTETTIWSTAQRLNSLDHGVLLGSPLLNTTTYVLDCELRPVPVGVSGELYIGGAGVARGYHNRPDLTAEKFVPDPFSGIAGTRLYRTGDLCRYRPDGRLKFVGRIDNQVKLRGHRIELSEIASVLEQHESVSQAVVDIRPALYDPADQQIVAYVVPSAQSWSSISETNRNTLETEQLIKWQASWEEVYRRKPTQTDPTFNINGWRSSYTGDPIPAEEMKEWLEQTVNSILVQRPQRVLEIGCGTGMLLFRIAPHCLEYHVTDVSPKALQDVEKNVKEQRLPRIKFFQLHAHQVKQLGDHDRDAVILNSVIQYFPNVDYLLDVLEQAVNLISASGFIFIGDVRNLRLLDAFHASVEHSRAPDSLPLTELRRMVRERVGQEEELCIDPDFFPALQQRLKKIRDVAIELKPGRYQNELSWFRFDVILRINSEKVLPAAPQVIDWRSEALTLTSIKQKLLEQRPELLIINGIPNRRLAGPLAVARSLAEVDGGTVLDLRASLPRESPAESFEPEDFRDLAREISYATRICWSAEDDRFDVVLARDSVSRFEKEPISLRARPWQSLANNPLQWLQVSRLVPELRAYLKERLPDYMLPSAMVLLDQMPLTPNGKIDRRALPAGKARSQVSPGFVAARDELERQLAQLWEETLNVRPIGIRDDFFELGGHSLLALVLLGRIRTSLRRQLPLSIFFPSINIETMASALREQARPDASSSLLKIQPNGRRPAFFCVHTALGFAFHYATLARHLGDDQPFFGLQAVGLDGDVEPITDAARMAAHYVSTIEEVDPVGPYFIGGSSLGALVAFEMAQQLRRKGKEVALLALFDMDTGLDDRPSLEEIEKVDDAELLAFVLEEYLKLNAERLRQMTPDQQLLYVLEEAKSANIFPPGFGVEHLRRLLRVYKATARAWVTYQPQAYDRKITLFRAVEQKIDRGPDSTMGWKDVAPERVDVYRIPGDHVSIFREPQVRVLARRLGACIKGSQTKGS